MSNPHGEYIFFLKEPVEFFFMTTGSVIFQVSALNEATPGSVKSVFKAWEHRLNSSGVPHLCICVYQYHEPCC